ncbi:hypothetical protein OESDEN_20237 [Oesophagostomum dentatum]|uniref:Uncharacterized protein n=1 Tax=Oesophagostomum dentatum TaxID=61180 RepID=A0A0B1S9B5_OESDE|nr:hypothetical protein OESDEN_20237 [Oesophagostomum dentatum]
MRIAPYALLKVSERILPKIPVRMSGTKILTKDTINPQVITMQYAVRGPIVIRAVELEKELAKVLKVFYAFHIGRMLDCHMSYVGFVPILSFPQFLVL